jgi:hypothetical protein
MFSFTLQLLYPEGENTWRTTISRSVHRCFIRRPLLGDGSGVISPWWFPIFCFYARKIRTGSANDHCVDITKYFIRNAQRLVESSGDEMIAWPRLEWNYDSSSRNGLIGTPNNLKNFSYRIWDATSLLLNTYLGLIPWVQYGVVWRVFSLTV